MSQDEQINYTKKKFREIQEDKSKRIKNRRFRKLRAELIKGERKQKKQ